MQSHRYARRAALAITFGLAALAAPSAAPAADLPPVTDLPTPHVTDAQLNTAFAQAVARGERPRKLRAARPAWFTRRVERRLARDRNGVIRAPVDAPLPGE